MYTSMGTKEWKFNTTSTRQLRIQVGQGSVNVFETDEMMSSTSCAADMAHDDMIFDLIS